MTLSVSRLGFAAAAYLLGAFPTGYLLVRARTRSDIRSLGSGATGATNVLRAGGWRAALAVAVIDLLKGAVPAVLALRFFADPAFSAQAASLAVLGHCYPVYIGFRGGKGVATAAGAMAALAPLPAAASLALFAVIVAMTRYVSLGSVLAAAAFPGLALLARVAPAIAVWSVPIVVLILVRHAPNIRRLLAGREAKLGDRSGSER
jgi:glycerol-3-phosphate acyltransferase PlsY